MAGMIAQHLPGWITHVRAVPAQATPLILTRTRRHVHLRPTDALQREARQMLAPMLQGSAFLRGNATLRQLIDLPKHNNAGGKYHERSTDHGWAAGLLGYDHRGHRGHFPTPRTRRPRGWTSRSRAVRPWTSQVQVGRTRCRAGRTWAARDGRDDASSRSPIRRVGSAKPPSPSI